MPSGGGVAVGSAVEPRCASARSTAVFISAMLNGLLM
jgi:hypothetical protein